MQRSPPTWRSRRASLECLDCLEQAISLDAWTTCGFARAGRAISKVCFANHERMRRMVRVPRKSVARRVNAPECTRMHMKEGMRVVSWDSRRFAVTFRDVSMEIRVSDAERRNRRCCGPRTYCSRGYATFNRDKENLGRSPSDVRGKRARYRLGKHGRVAMAFLASRRRWLARRNTRRDREIDVKSRTWAHYHCRVSG